MVLRAVFRTLRRDPLYVASGILALAIGLAAALVAGLYVRDELSFDGFIPGHDRIGVVVTRIAAPGQGDISTDYTPGMLARSLKAQVPGVADASRLAYDNVSLGRGAFQRREAAAWVDPSFFRLLRLPALKGDPSTALAAPDAAVVTESVAKDYLGPSYRLGAPIQVNGTEVFRVRAVIRDIPPNSHLAQLGVFLSGSSPMSPLTRQREDGFYNAVIDPGPTSHVRFVRERTYVRLARGFGFPGLSNALGRWSQAQSRQVAPTPQSKIRFDAIPLRELHTFPIRGVNLGDTDLHADRGSLIDLAVLGGLILLLAATNFVNLATARSTRRAREVGVRKAAGAAPFDLMRQFLAETFVQVLIASVLAVAIVELALGPLNGFLMKDIRFEPWRDPMLAGAVAGALMLVTVLSGAYPAFVLASFRPAQALRGAGGGAGGSMAVRNGLVAFQFSVLMALLIGAGVVWLQARFATNEGLRLDKDGVLIVHATPCRGSFAEEVRRLPGVRVSGCSSAAMLGLEDLDMVVTDAPLRLPGHPTATVALGMADFDVFQALGVVPLAGRLFDRGHPRDELPMAPPGGRRGSTILNESAARRLGFSRPADAVGRVVQVPVSGRPDDRTPRVDLWQVIGVVPDFTLDLKSAAVKPTAYLIDPIYPFPQALAVRLDGRRTPETLAAIDRLWRLTGHSGAPRRQFLDDYVQRLYLATLRQGALLSALCAIAALLACAGLLALSSYTAQQRTKEIGVRKAMGASAGEVVALLVGQFCGPVGLGVLFGAPVAYAAARHWLEGFSYHIALEPWVFAAAGAITLLVGIGAGLFHAVAVARARPVEALRYE